MFTRTRTRRARLRQGHPRRARAGTLTGGAALALGLGLAGCGAHAAGSSPSLLVAGDNSDQLCAMAAQFSQEERKERAAGQTGPEMAHIVAANWAKLAAIAPAEVAPDLHQIADTTQRQADGKAGNEADRLMLPAVEHYHSYVSQHCPQARKTTRVGG